jgi:hypothetical protein
LDRQERTLLAIEEERMKRSVDDTDEISDHLSRVRARLHIARLACDGLAGDDGALIADLIFEIEEELKEIARQLYPPACEEGIEHIRRQVELGIANLVEERQAAEREESRDFSITDLRKTDCLRRL